MPACSALLFVVIGPTLRLLPWRPWAGFVFGRGVCRCRGAGLWQL